MIVNTPIRLLPKSPSYFRAEARLIGKMNDQNLAELIRQSRNGSSQAIERLVTSCQPAAFRLALFILDEPDEADDATQDSFIQAMKAIPSYRAEASFQTWFYRIIVNNCIGKLRKRRTSARLHHLLINLIRHDLKADAPPEMQTIRDESTDLIIRRGAASLRPCTCRIITLPSPPPPQSP